MSSYSYDVSLNISTSSADVSLPDRGTRSATTSLNPNTPSSDVGVDSNISWINAPSDQDVKLPSGSERYLFDMANPYCWPGTGGTIFDLSGNGYNCQHAQLNLLYDDPTADTSPNGSCNYQYATGFSFTDDSNVLDYVDTGYSPDLGTYLHINPDIENENVKYIRWPAPGTVNENYTFFMVTEAIALDDYELSEDLDPGEPIIDENPSGDFTILGKTFGATVSSRGAGAGYGGPFLNRGHVFSGPTTSAATYSSLVNFGIPTAIYGRQYEFTHGTYGGGSLGRSRLLTPFKYYVADTSLFEDVYDLLSASYTSNLENRVQISSIGNYLSGSSLQFARFDHTGIQVFSVTGTATKARTYVNGEYIGEVDQTRNLEDSASPYWTSGVGQNGNDTVRACSARETKLYAWGFYDRALTTEEHLEIHRKYFRHPNPTASVDVGGIPDYALFNTASNLGRPDVDVKMDSDPSATKSYDISLDLSSASADVSVTPLPDLSV